MSFGKRNISKVDGATASVTNKKMTISTNSVHPFFKPPPPIASTSYIKIPSPPTLEHHLYLDPFLSGVIDVDAEPVPQPIISPVKVAFCDLDGCLIKPKGNSSWPKNKDDWEWWSPGVKRKMKVWQDEGYHVVIISNQKLTKGEGGLKKLEEWRKKMPIICRDLPVELPLRVMAATGADQYRKPRIGMFDCVKQLYAEKGLSIDMEKSFFVGDAAGRKGDHSDTDRKWAINAGLRFHVPEELFKDQPPPLYPALKGFDALAYLAASEYLPAVTPTSTPILPNGSKREIVIFVGSPAGGKTTFYKTYFEPSGYVHVNQDTLKSRDKCLQRVRQVLEEGKFGCIVDNTNRNANTRSLYIKIARELNVPIRAFFFTATAELARHNNAYRAWVATNVLEENRREILPDFAFLSFKSDLEEPTKSEGFNDVKRVNFVFRGTAEERAQWSRWMF